MTATCTTRYATTGACSKAAVYTEGEFAECAECAAQHGSLRSTRHMVRNRCTGPAVGDVVVVHRYGLAYTATVTRVGARGAVYATFTYGNGAERTVRV